MSSAIQTFRLPAALVLAVAMLGGSAWATDVTLRLVDQHGNPIAGTTFLVNSVSTVPQDGVISLAVGSHTVQVQPGRNGNPGSASLLHRSEVINVSGLSQLVEFTWPTASLNAEILDQFGAPIPNSLWDPVNVGGGRLPAGTAVTVPVTEDPAETLLGSMAIQGYSMELFPGRNGNPGNEFLRREEDSGPVTVAGVTHSITWPTAPLVAEILDQFGSPIPNSTWDPINVGGGILPAGTAVTVVVTEDPAATLLGDFATNGYSTELFPGRNGSPGNSLLRRQEGVGPVTAAGVTHSVTWPTATLAAEILDQFGAPIPNSHWDPINVGGGFLPAGTTITVPVTDDPAATLLGDLATNGYSTELFPGRNGSPGNALLRRQEGVGHLTVAGVNHIVTWPTATLAAEVLDQFGAPIAGSQWDPIQVGGGVMPVGTAVTVPVTEDPAATLLGDIATNGYAAELFPGRNGGPGDGDLSRQEDAGPLTVAGGTLSITWEIASGSLSVVDSSETEVAGSSMRVAGQSEIATGTTVSFPVNDDVVFPTLAGAYAGGYPVSIRLASGDPLSGPFDFEFQPSEVINPPFVDIAGSDYGLRFDVQPVIDLDNDGFAVPDDCDDSDPAINPAAAELPGNTVDENCDGALDCDPCDAWRNHGHYVSCVAQAVDVLTDAGDLTTEEGDDLVSNAAQSDVGKKNHVPPECQ